MYVGVGCSSTHNKLGLACSLFIIILLNILLKKKNSLPYPNLLRWLQRVERKSNGNRAAVLLSRTGT